MTGVDQHIQHIKQLINESQYVEAYHLSENQLITHPNEERLQQAKALALSKLGDIKDALEYFEPLWRTHTNMAESAGIMGSIYKAKFIASEEPEYGRLSAQTYLENFKKTNDWYTGVNAATMAKLTGDAKTTKEIARTLVDLLSRDELDFWQEASLAEAYLLLKQMEKATAHYIKARRKMGNNWGAVNSVRRQLWLLDHYMKVPKPILEFFEVPVIATFIGHMMDRPDRELARFSPPMEQDIRSAIRSAILNLNIQIGYCSLACGSDILFAEEMLELGREVNVYLPFQIHDFIQTSVAFAGDHWVRRFEKIMETLPHVHYLTEYPFNGDDYFFRLLADCISGAAILRAKFMAAEPVLLAAVSQFDLQRKTGGVRDLLHSWPDRNTIHPVNIDIYRNTSDSAPSQTYLRLDPHFRFNTDFQLIFTMTVSFPESPESQIDVDDLNEVLYAQFSSDSKNWIQFTRFYAVMQTVMNLTEQKHQFKAGVYFGVINEHDDLTHENNAITFASALCDRAPMNTVLVTEPLSFLFITQSVLLENQYAGELKIAGHSLGNVYRLSRNEAT